MLLHALWRRRALVNIAYSYRFLLLLLQVITTKGVVKLAALLPSFLESRESEFADINVSPIRDFESAPLQLYSPSMALTERPASFVVMLRVLVQSSGRGEGDREEERALSVWIKSNDDSLAHILCLAIMLYHPRTTESSAQLGDCHAWRRDSLPPPPSPPFSITLFCYHFTHESRLNDAYINNFAPFL